MKFTSNTREKKTQYSTTPLSSQKVMPTSTGALNGHSNNETDNTSLISSSLSSMSFPENNATPLRLSGIPFSWEKLPGIPKHQSPNKNDHYNFLPLPPAGNTPRKSGKKPPAGDSFDKDPFFAAFIECSKDEDDTLSNFWKGTKVARSFSDRLGFVNFYTSCKNASAVCDSVVYLPRSNRSSQLQ